MAEYIEREAALKAVKSLRVYYKYEDDNGAYNTIKRTEVIEAIEAIPAADVRPVVLCRDCKYYRQDAKIADAKGLVREWYCPIHEAEFAEDAFCSYGRRTSRGES